MTPKAVIPFFDALLFIAPSSELIRLLLEQLFFLKFFQKHFSNSDHGTVQISKLIRPPIILYVNFIVSVMVASISV